ncbi:MAG: tRNA epoxyqueuosine(34) reductase QueG [Thermoplasmatales archaeon]
MIVDLEAPDVGSAVSSLRVRISDTTTLDRWISNGFNANMSYISKTDRLMKIRDSSLLMKDARSIIIFLFRYGKGAAPKEGYGRIAAYAQWFDYHETLRDEITRYIIENNLYLNNFKVYVDTGPIEEREISRLSGLGWIGKNSMLIHRVLGSFTFIGAAVTDIIADTQIFPQPDLCGKCTRCIDSCPTHAIMQDRTIDSNKCISYHTIENRGIIPANIAVRMNDMIFGCDICNDVCPWNSDKKIRSDLLRYGNFSMKMKLEDIAYIDQDRFLEEFRYSAIRRAGAKGLARNAVVALFNAGKYDIVKDIANNFNDLRGSQARLLLESGDG